MAVNRRVIWLGVAAIVLIVAVIMARPNDSGPPQNRPAAARGRAAAVAADAEQLPPDVKLGALTRQRAEPEGHGRNPFRFQARAQTSRPPPVVNTPPPPETGAATGAGYMPNQPAGPPPPPPIALKFIGVVEKMDGTKIAVLSDGRRPIYGVEGQEIEGQYRLLKVGLESLEIAYLDGRGRTTIRLTGQ
jgi:hypothetical protein